MLKLSDRKWKWFTVDNLFSIERVKGLPIENYAIGNIPYITTSSVNNALVGFVATQDKAISLNNSISIDPIKGKCFFHPYKFVGRGFSGASINLLYAPQLNKYTALFIATSIERTSCAKASYGYLFNSNRLKQGTFLLPIDSNEKPDYEFMERYIKQIINTKHDEYRRFLNKQTNKQTNINQLNSKKWKPFFISGENGVFYLRASNSGIDKNKLQSCETENVPYITRSDMNNGVSLFIGNRQNQKYKKDKGNVITVGLDTQTAFYQPHDFFTGQNIQVLGSDMLNKSRAMFLIPLLKAQLSKFNWGGNGATLGRLKRTKILLPVDNNDMPDYLYMESYINNKLSEKYLRYLNYLK